jgi:hypothetical protein
MSVVMTHRYSVDLSDLGELLARRITLIEAIRASYPGLVEVRLIRLSDGTYTDIWRWESAEQLKRALSAAGDFPEVAAAMALTRDRTTVDGEIVDER